MRYPPKKEEITDTGRLHRQYKGKTEIKIYDYVDSNMPVLHRIYKRRLKAYKALGYVEKTPL